MLSFKHPGLELYTTTKLTHEPINFNVFPKLNTDYKIPPNVLNLKVKGIIEMMAYLQYQEFISPFHDSNFDSNSQRKHWIKFNTVFLKKPVGDKFSFLSLTRGT